MSSCVLLPCEVSLTLGSLLLSGNLVPGEQLFKGFGVSSGELEELIVGLPAQLGLRLSEPLVQAQHEVLHGFTMLSSEVVAMGDLAHR